MLDNMRVKALNGCPLFEGLSGDELASALDFYGAHEKSYQKGDFLIRAGEPVVKFGLVLSGAVQIMMDDFDGQHMIMATVAVSQTFGESLCYRGVSESPVYACAVEPSDIMWLGCERIASGYGECMQCGRFIRMLTLKTLSMNDRIQVLSKPTLREKLMTLLSQHSTRDGKNFNLPFDRESMAAYLGVNRSALSRELSALRSEGKIDFYKNSFTILSRHDE